MQRPSKKPAAAVASEEQQQKEQQLQQQKEQQQQEQHFDDMLTSSAASVGILLPSKLAFNALLAIPLLLWLIATATGVLHFVSLPVKGPKVEHLMLWFDKLVFGPAGSLLPLAMLAFRWAALNLLRQQPAAEEPTPARGAVGDTSAATAAAAAGGEKLAEKKQQRGGARSTLPGACLMVYLTVALARIGMYCIHLVLQDGGDGKRAPAWISDHMLLGASVAACLQVELVCALSDVIKAQAASAPLVRELACACVLVGGMFVYGFTTLDMYFTAYLFHPPAETLASLVLGLLLFQSPLLLWLKQRYAEGPYTTDHIA